MPYSSDGHDVPKYIRGDKKRRQFSHVWNSEYQRQKGKGKSDAESERIAFASANSVTSKAAEQKFAKLLQKSVEDDAFALAQSIIDEILKDFDSVPGEVRPSLENAAKSGVGAGLLQIETADPKVISSGNAAAEKYALERAAELVGKKYDVEGNLVDNPDARWAISDTTRNRIREIVAEAFTEDTPMSEIKDEIQAALQDESQNSGIFSAARAGMIARTEVMRAQTGGNFEVWQKSGIVKSIQWLSAEDASVCPVCEDNDGVVVEIGKPFPSGDIMPGAHPLCRCVAIVKEVTA